MPLDLNLRIQAFTEDYLQSPELKLDSRGQRDLTALLEDLGYRPGWALDGIMQSSEKGVHHRIKGDTAELLLEEGLFSLSYFSLSREKSKRFRDDYQKLDSLSSQLWAHEQVAELGIAAKTAAEKGMQCVPLSVVGLGALTYAGIRDQNIGEPSFFTLGLWGLGIVLATAGAGALIGYFIGSREEKKGQRAYRQLCDEVNELREKLKAYEPKAVYGAEALKCALTPPSS